MTAYTLRLSREDHWWVVTGPELDSVTQGRGLVGEEYAAAEQVGSGASVHLAFEHLDAVDVAFDGAGAPPEAEPVGDGLAVGAR
jgi:hypothetical protein